MATIVKSSEEAIITSFDGAELLNFYEFELLLLPIYQVCHQHGTASFLRAQVWQSKLIVQLLSSPTIWSLTKIENDQGAKNSEEVIATSSEFVSCFMSTDLKFAKKTSFKVYTLTSKHNEIEVLFSLSYNAVYVSIGYLLES